jgi:hypothetical protein
MRKLAGSLLLVFSISWWLGIGREFLKAVLFDKILRMLESNPTPLTDIVFQYGPPTVLAFVGLYLLASHGKQKASVIASSLELQSNKQLDEFIKTSLREGFKKYNILIEEGIRPSIKSKFLRRRSLYNFFAKSPLSFYWAKRRAEFIDSWTRFFHEHDKVTIVDLSTEHAKQNARITIALLYAVNQAPDEIYHLAHRPEDLRMLIEARMHRSYPADGAQSPGVIQHATGQVLPVAQYNKAKIGQMLDAIGAFYPPLSQIEKLMHEMIGIAMSLESNLVHRGVSFLLKEFDDFRIKLLGPIKKLNDAADHFGLYTEVSKIIENGRFHQEQFFNAYNDVTIILRQAPEGMSLGAASIFLETRKKALNDRTSEYLGWINRTKQRLLESRERYLQWKTID